MVRTRKQLVKDLNCDELCFMESKGIKEAEDEEERRYCPPCGE
jgi:hypothetical protein